MEEKNNNIGFAFLGIKTEQFAVFEENFNPKKDINLNTGLQFKIDHSTKQIGVFLEFGFEQQKKKFIKIQVSCHFKIEDEAWAGFVQEKESKLIIPKGFLEHISVITVGTTRGLLYAKTEGTQFSKYFVPLINVAEMIKEDAVFETNLE
jgi:hypothetical protein